MSRACGMFAERREAIDKRKMHWFRVWGIDPKDTTKEIWRIELRAGKKHLKDKWKLSTYADIEAAIGDVLQYTMEKVRYLVDRQIDCNITRQRLHPLWEEASRIATHALREHQAGRTPDQVRQVVREETIETYLRQIGGLLAGLSVALGLTDAETHESLSDHVAANLGSRLDDPRDTIWRSRERARKRLHFVS